MLTVALPKGRMGDSVFAFFTGGKAPEDTGRKLIVECLNYRFLLVKPADAAVYAERGAADVGVVGKDVILETNPDVYELLELPLGKCKMAVAAKKDYRGDPSLPVRVATKYPNIAKSHFAAKNMRADIIKLNGSIELAPILGLSDVIVDIVETGETLRENGLTVIEEISESCAVFIAGKSAYRFKSAEIEELLKLLSKETGEKFDKNIEI